VWVRREAIARAVAGEALGGAEVCTVLGVTSAGVDALTWGGMRSTVLTPVFLDLWERSPRRDLCVSRTVRLLDRKVSPELDIRRGGSTVFVHEWDSLAAVRRALAGYGLRLGKVGRRKKYGPIGYRYVGTTWSVRGHFREPAPAMEGK
jgi:hypothetical protein